MDDLKGRRELYQGFTDSFVKGLEFALTLAIFAAMGYGLDRLAGTTPILIIVFVVLGLVGLVTKAYYAYEAKMRGFDAAAPWGPGRGEGHAAG